MQLPNDDNSLLLATSISTVDRLNAHFYGKFPFPWKPVVINQPIDSDVWRKFLCQDVGDWRHESIPARPKIWIGGCGTNQAVMTALRFPAATVVGSDISESSLGVAKETAQQLGITNLTLRCESINDVTYDQEFDYVISTGVIHHNYDPANALLRLSAALKPAGILEMMVYNRYHRVLTTAFQKATQILHEQGDQAANDQFQIAKKLVMAFPVENLMGSWVRKFQHTSDPEFADALIQPVEYSYTVESINEMGERCNLAIASPCFNQFDKMNGIIGWNLNMQDPALEEIYYSLPDARRWQVTNLLSMEKSPMLWFYMQRRDGERRVQTEREMCDGFLSSAFKRNDYRQKSLVLKGDAYEADKNDYPISSPPLDHAAKILLAAIQPGVKMKDLFARCRISDRFPSVNMARIQLTTSSYPLIIAEGGSK